MAMTIHTNAVSMAAQRQLSVSGSALSTAMQRLSSGVRVNSAKDDAAGLAIAQRMQSRVQGLAVAARNVSDGISLAQTAEGALGKVGDMLQRMRELAVQASNATNSADDRQALQAEVVQLRAEVDRVAKTTSFNGQHLLDGSLAAAVFQVGSEAGDNITVGALQNTTVAALASVQTGASQVEVPAGTIQVLTEVSGLSITVGGTNTVYLDTLGAATSQEERLGQWVAAVNAKTADTGVTAFLETDAAGKSTLYMRSDSAQTVQLSGGALNSVGFRGALTEVQAGTLAGSTDPLITAAFAAADAVDARGKITTALDAYGISPDATLTLLLGQNGNGPLDLNALNMQFSNALNNFSRAAAPGALDIETVTTRQGMQALSVLTQADAWDALKSLDSAIDQVNAARGSLGALQARFEKTVENIDIQSENLAAARGRIVDADFAAETANLSRAQILQQAGTAMVAQANQLPQNVLSLLR